MQKAVNDVIDIFTSEDMESYFVVKHSHPYNEWVYSPRLYSINATAEDGYYSLKFAARKLAKCKWTFGFSNFCEYKNISLAKFCEWPQSGSK